MFLEFVFRIDFYFHYDADYNRHYESYSYMFDTLLIYFLLITYTDFWSNSYKFNNFYLYHYVDPHENHLKFSPVKKELPFVSRLKLHKYSLSGLAERRPAHHLESLAYPLLSYRQLKRIIFLHLAW